MSISPEATIENKSESPSEIAGYLEARYKATPLLIPEVPYQIHDSDALAMYDSAEYGVSHKLMSTVQAGNEFFNLVEVDTLTVPEGALEPVFLKSLAITKYIPGERAELVGLLNKENEQITIGRSHAGDSANRTLSGKHFSVSLGEGGSVFVIDHDSTNQTILYTPENYNEDDCIVIETKDPLKDPDFWCSESLDVKRQMIAAA